MTCEKVSKIKHSIWTIVSCLSRIGQLFDTLGKSRLPMVVQLLWFLQTLVSKRTVSNLPASLFWIVWPWTLSRSPWESHLPKMCFPVCVNTGGSLFRHVFFKICREGLSFFFFPYGISKALLKHLRSPAELSQLNHIGRSPFFFSALNFLPKQWDHSWRRAIDLSWPLK